MANLESVLLVLHHHHFRLLCVCCFDVKFYLSEYNLIMRGASGSLSFAPNINFI